VTRRLERAGAGAPPPAPVRLVHLGLGGFHRAHQAWYTMADPEWGIAAYTFRSAALPRALTEQGGLYSLRVRGEPDVAQVVTSISRAHPGVDRDRWLADVASPDVAVLTLTVTEAAYQVARPGEDGAVARLVAGLRYRWRTGGAPLAVVPCDKRA
jgi:fructuronate reductase